MDVKKVIIIGAGPAGMMAAIRAADFKHDVILIEKNAIPGRKLLLSGKGRCNLTNACDLDSFLKRFYGQGDFLRDAFKKFFVCDLMRFFEERGLQLKVERQERVFPVTDRSHSIADILKKELERKKVKVLYSRSVLDIRSSEGRVTGVGLDNGVVLPAEKVVVATGGVSYTFTGSTGDGLRWAEKLGHRITPLRGGLVPLETKEKYPASLEGVTLKNIKIIFSRGNKSISSDIGELIFTSTGISGPLVLSLSGYVSDWLKEQKHQKKSDKDKVFADIDLKPALSEKQLHDRLVREFKINATKSIKNTLKELLPMRMIEVFLSVSGIPPAKKANQINSEERGIIVTLLKRFRFEITRTRPLEEAMVTRGGVSLKDINPRTMESRLIQGLYFAGEILDVDADTGGFNLQSAFSTGYAAGESAANN